MTNLLTPNLLDSKLVKSKISSTNMLVRYQNDDIFRANQNNKILSLTNKSLVEPLSDTEKKQLQTLVNSIGKENLAIAVRESVEHSISIEAGRDVEKINAERELAQTIKLSIQTAKKEADIRKEYDPQLRLAIASSNALENKLKAKEEQDIQNACLASIKTNIEETKKRQRVNETSLPVSKRSKVEAKVVTDAPVKTTQSTKTNERVLTSASNLHCGYHALAIGVLGYSKTNPEKVKQTLKNIGFDPCSLTGNIKKDQLTLGSKLKQYGQARKSKWINNTISELGVTGPLKREIEESLKADTFISADYLTFIGKEINIAVRLNNAPDQDGVDNIRVYNENSVHYTGTMPADVKDTYKQHLLG